MKAIVMLALVFACGTAFGQQGVHKCQKPDGTSTYQPTPCVDGIGKVLVEEKPKPPDPLKVFKIDHEKQLAEVRKNLALFEKAQNSLGISQEDFLKERRRPDDINVTTTFGIKREQWIYDQGYGREYYYFENGKLVAVQN